MHFNYTVFIDYFALILWVRLLKDCLVLFTLCLDQPGFTLCWVGLARALLWDSGGLMSIYQSRFIYAIIHVMQEHFMHVNRNMDRPPRKTVQPQDIWLCLG
jgi:hypothetical protein